MPRFQHRPGTRPTLATSLCPGASTHWPPASALVRQHTGHQSPSWCAIHQPTSPSPGGLPKPACQPLRWQATTLAHQPCPGGHDTDPPAPSWWVTDNSLPALSVSLTPGVKQTPAAPDVASRHGTGQPQGCPSRPGSAKQTYKLSTNTWNTKQQIKLSKLSE